MIPVEGSGGRAFTTNGRFTRFKIENGFRGAEGETIDTFEHGTSCDYHFKPGERYFVYAGRNAKDGRLYVSSCSATRTIDQASNDVAYAEGVKRNEPTPSIIGSVTRETRRKANEYRQFVAVEGVRVLADGPNKRTEAYTDSKGVFRFFGLEPGEYNIRALTSSDLRVTYGSNTFTVRVLDGRCSGGQFALTSLPTISGRVLNADGLPEKIRLSLVPLDDAGNEIPPAEGPIETYSSDKGEYTFNGLAPGRYLVAVNWRNQPGTYDPPYPRAYLPGVSQRGQATVIDVSDGAQVNAGDFTLPSQLVRRIIEGVVLQANGAPAANALITVEFTDREWSETASADGEGRFKVTLFDGFRYLIAGEVRREVQGRWTGTHSLPKEVVVGPTNEPVMLTISRPGFYVPHFKRKRTLPRQ